MIKTRGTILDRSSSLPIYRPHAEPVHGNDAGAKKNKMPHQGSTASCMILNVCLVRARSHLLNLFLACFPSGNCRLLFRNICCSVMEEVPPSSSRSTSPLPSFPRAVLYFSRAISGGVGLTVPSRVYIHYNKMIIIIISMCTCLSAMPTSWFFLISKFYFL